jgi:hypothetical protein
MVTVACKTAIFGKFAKSALTGPCAGTIAETSKTTATVDAAPVNTFPTVATCIFASPCRDGLFLPAALTVARLRRPRHHRQWAEPKAQSVFYNGCYALDVSMLLSLSQGVFRGVEQACSVELTVAMQIHFRS